MTPFKKVTLQTPRLNLRFLDQDDAPALLTLFTDAETLRYFSCTPWQHLDLAVEHITQTQQGYRERWFVGEEISDSIIYGLLAREWQAAIHPAQ